jgi:hypothetical protein
MTENPRSTLLRRARRSTAGIVLGTLAGTGLLTVAIATTAQQVAGQDPIGTPTTEQPDGSSGTSGGSGFGSSASGVGPGTGSGSSDGGSHAS